MSTTEPDAGLRERKKQRTHQAIVGCALRLFAERGYAATTIADIAAAADISPRTFFGYFPSKEDVLFADANDAFAAFLTALDEPRQGTRTAVDVLRDWIHGWFAEHPQDREERRLLHRLKSEAPGIEAHERHLMARFEDAMAAALAVDLHLAPGDVRARMVAAAAVASLKALEPEGDGACEAAGPEDEERALRALDDALVFLDAGLAALRP